MVEKKDDMVSLAEAKLIARDAADNALNQHVGSLPLLLKPMMFEVAETVSKRQEATFLALFSKVIGADVRDDDKIRDIHKDLYYLRDKRTDHERATIIAKDTILHTITKWSFVTVVIAVFSFFGKKIGGS